MKKLICAKDVEAMSKQGKKVIYIDKDILITPSAKDAARACGIEFSKEMQDLVSDPAPVCVAAVACETIAPESEPKEQVINTSDGGVDTNMIYTVLKALADKGLLNGVLDVTKDFKPYEAEKGGNGIKIVRGNSVQYKAIDKGNPFDKVFYQEIINKDDGCSMSAGFITIENGQFHKKCTCDEIYYIIEGTLTVTIDGKVYSAQAGDSIFLPNSADVALGSSNMMKAFYAAY